MRPLNFGLWINAFFVWDAARERDVEIIPDGKVERKTGKEALICDDIKLR
jgi:hypothetical protein